jgi:hypothetical protein
VDPSDTVKDSSVIIAWTALARLFGSADSGASFAESGQCHDCQHSVTFGPFTTALRLRR